MPESKPLVTVIVPSYNSPDLFGALDSVLMQDYPRIQLILADDASASFSREEVERYLKHNKRDNLEDSVILMNFENRGTVYTLNQALKHSRGKYIFNLAADDSFFDSRVLSDWVEAFVQSGASVMTARRAVCDENLEWNGQTEPNEAEIQMIHFGQPESLFEQIAMRNFIFGCCTARSAESFQTHGLYDETYRLIEDHPTNLKLLRAGVRFEFFNRIVIRYRRGGVSAPTQYNEAYHLDVDLVLTQEVLPYTKHPTRMKIAFYQWKRDQRLLKKRANQLLRHAESKTMKVLINVWYYLHFPLRTMRSLPKYLKKLGKGS